MSHFAKRFDNIFPAIGRTFLLFDIFDRIVEKDSGVDKNMLRRILPVLFVFVVLMAAAMPALAWDDTGHKITA